MSNERSVHENSCIYGTRLHVRVQTTKFYLLEQMTMISISSNVPSQSYSIPVPGLEGKTGVLSIF
jgi:hypothetical protein